MILIRTPDLANILLLESSRTKDLALITAGDPRALLSRL